jgi:ATP-dependent DNA helicase RecG
MRLIKMHPAICRFAPADAMLSRPATDPDDMLTSDTTVTRLRGIGPQLAERLSRLDIHCLEDLLWHLPLRYRDLTHLTPVGGLQLHHEALVEGTVRACDVVFGKRRSLLCLLQDGSGVLALRFYYFSKSQQQQLSPGVRIRAWGEVRRGTSGYEMYHPEYRLFDHNDPPPLAERLTPVYPTTDGVQQTRISNLVEQTLSIIEPAHLHDWLPSALLPTNLRMSLMDALHYLHRPPTDAPVARLQDGTHPTQQRLAFEELVAHHLSLLHIRAQVQREPAAPLPHDAKMHSRFLQQLSFTLTAAQQRVSQDITQDLAQPYPMLRLVQGDVGSGKTVVAALAMLQAVANGQQAVLMAPTEILAQQHFKQFEHWFTPLGYQVCWIAGQMKASDRRSALSALADGSAHIVIGTHALIEQDVTFKKLALVVTDEQHRFGVRQRLALREKSASSLAAHQLIMTATPIPRTLAMTAYADLDCSIIDERPPGRTPVQTTLVSQSRRDAVIARLHAACGEGRQAYWVCTLVEESDDLQCQAAETVVGELTAALPELTVGLIHGRLKPAEKNAVMDAFKRGDIRLLVATTVIEVGVDVPNASLMIIENPERLGLAQLHQLRGRVGRGSTASHCLLLYSTPLTRNAKSRLTVLRDSDDGFVIAEKDLELRGPGELLGTRQTGEIAFRIADTARDAAWLPQVKHCAEQLLLHYPDHVEPLIRRWLRSGERYVRT